MPSLSLPAARRAGALSLVAGAAVLISGCYSITGQTAAQRDVNGDVDVTTALCQSGAGPAGAQRDDSNCVISDSSAIGLPVQLFVSYLVPDGFDDPTVGSGTGILTGVTFTKAPADLVAPITVEPEPPVYPEPDPDYPSATEPVPQPEVPPLTPSGFHWVTYSSSAVTTLNRGTDELGYPSSGPTEGPLNASINASFDTEDTYQDLRLRTAISWRWLGTLSNPADPAYASDRPVVCGQPQGSSRNAQTTDTACLTSTASAVPSTTPDDFMTIPTTRLEVLGPQFGGEDVELPTITAGTTGKVQFGQFGHVAPGAPVDTVPLSGDTEMTGAVVTTEDHLKIGSEDAIDVNVAVPASTPAGDYKVGVEAGEGTGTRSTWQLIHVNAAPPAAPAPTPGTAPAPPAPAPTVAEKLVTGVESFSNALESKKKTRALRKGSVKLPFTVPAGGTIRVSVLGKPTGKGKNKKAPVLAVGTATVKEGGIVDIKLKRTEDGERLFKSGKKITGTIVVRLKTKDGKTISTTVPITLD